MGRGRALMCRRDVPYMPSFIVPLPELSPTIRNITDLIFFPGFYDPTLAILFRPLPTATGRSASPRDTFHLEIRTLDPLGETYPLISSAKGLPYDAQYLVPCPRDIGGLLVVTATGIVHVDQSWKFVATSTSGWWRFISTDAPTTTVGTEDGGRLDRELNHPSAVCLVLLETEGQGAFFTASAVGDSHLVSVRMIGEETRMGSRRRERMRCFRSEDGMSHLILITFMRPVQPIRPTILFSRSSRRFLIQFELAMIDRQLMQAHLAIVDKVARIGYIADMKFGGTPEEPAARESDVSVSERRQGRWLTSF